MSETAKQPEVDPRGRLDIAAKRGARLVLGALGQAFGAPWLESEMQPIVDRLIDEHVSSDPIPLTGIAIAERLKLIKTEKQLQRRKQRKAGRRVRS